MRPALLFSLFADLQNMKGVGPKRYQAYRRLGCYTVRDLLFHYPVGVVDRRAAPPLPLAQHGQVITVMVTVMRHTVAKYRAPYKILCENESGQIQVMYFNAHSELLQNKFIVGKQLVISGEVKRHMSELHMIHPDIIAPPERFDDIRVLEPVYPLTYGLNNTFLAQNISNIVKYLPKLPEWLPANIMAKYHFPSWQQAVYQVHHPKVIDEVTTNSKAKERLAFDELLAQQLSLKIARRNNIKKTKAALIFGCNLVKQLKLNLPFALTEAQEDAIEVIAKDQASPQRMTRLLQGDVGSGKTLVALCAMLNAVEAGAQAVLMAPTEVLARQHHCTISALVAALGLRCELLIGKSKASTRNKALENIASGASNLIIGTHALLQEKVDFHKLSLVVIDEQHRFGVEQRQSIMSKGSDTELLLMSATPIPRTLSMVSYGDLDVTLIQQKPKSRLPIDTKLVPSNRLDETVAKLRDAVNNGTKAYWLCPLIEESEKLDLTDLSKRYDMLAAVMPGKVGFLHGQMKADEKNEIMQKFISGQIQVLVATTVIEVGVDVADATVMIIENAERFGLSQLHQLRGRVGRGSMPSSCILLYKQPIGKISYERLRVIRNSEDGFEIAQKDLQIRGSGEVLGTKQSGLPAFKNFNFWEQQHLIDASSHMAEEVMKQDPLLQSAEYNNLKILLHLYDHDRSLSYIYS